MTRLAEIEAHIASMSELLEIVGAMRSLAGMHMQDAQRVLPGIRRYAETMAAGIADTLLLTGELPPSPLEDDRPRALVLCAGEHGFVGGFNERLVEAALPLLSAQDCLFMLGTRGALLALERGRKPFWSHPMATRCASATETVEALSQALYGHIAEGRIGRVEIMYPIFRQGVAPTIEHGLLLPLDETALKSRQPRQPPLHNLAPAVLHERLVEEYVFARLTEAAVEAIASENSARFATMTSAHENVSKKVDELSSEAHQTRQSEITTELLELVSGANALENSPTR